MTQSRIGDRLSPVAVYFLGLPVETKTGGGEFGEVTRIGNILLCQRVGLLRVVDPRRDKDPARRLRTEERTRVRPGRRILEVDFRRGRCFDGGSLGPRTDLARRVGDWWTSGVRWKTWDVPNPFLKGQTGIYELALGTTHGAGAPSRRTRGWGEGGRGAGAETRPTETRGWTNRSLMRRAASVYYRPPRRLYFPPRVAVRLGNNYWVIFPSPPSLLGGKGGAGVWRRPRVFRRRLSL